MKNLIPLILITLPAIILISCGSSSDDTTLYDVSVTVSPNGAGTIAPSADSAYEEGEDIQLQAQANDEYLFTGWGGSMESTDNPLSVTVDKTYGLTAHFERKDYEMAVTTEGEGTVVEQIVESKAGEYAHGTVVELIAMPLPDAGYRFVEWTGDVEGTDNPAKITVDDPKEVTAVFEKKSYELTVRTEGEGAVSEEVVEPKAKEYEHGAVVELTASPATGWEFAGWQGDWSGRDNPAQIIVDDPKEVTAIFEQQGSFYLAENGMTIRCPEAEVGQTGVVTGVVNGLTYTKRSAGQITPANAATTCTSGITDMSFMFDGATNFNGDISHWDVSSVTDMEGIFRGATSFDQDLGGLDVSSVTNMSSMFNGASSFNGDIEEWDVSSVTNMSTMFFGTNSFNQDIGGWDVGNVTTMQEMFNGADAFNQDLGGWDISSVTRMMAMFQNATSFDQDLSGWCVSDINSEPSDFSADAGFEGDNGKMPVWGTCP